MTYVTIAGRQYPATITGRLRDKDWDGRASKSIKLTMTHAEAAEIWVDGASWTIVAEHIVDEPKIDETGNEVIVETVVTEEFDNSDYEVAGPITDNRDGTMTIKMGKPTDAELLAIIMGGK